MKLEREDGTTIWEGDVQTVFDALNKAHAMGANLGGANLVGANLVGALLPDGRSLDEYSKDPLAGICEDLEATKRAFAAWGNHTWTGCPMHAAHGWSSVGDAPEAKRLRVDAFVALFDANLLPSPDAISG